MPSSDESDTDNIVPERDTQFVARSDDDEILWEVEEITAERGNKYKVKWVGFNPATGKRWPQDWVPKHDCTDLLVAQWNAKKKRIANGKKRGGRTTSTASRASGSSKRTGSSSLRRKTRTPVSEATSSRVDSVGLDPSPPPPPKKASSKRGRQSETPATTTSSGKGDGEAGVSRPKKKRKTMLEVLVPPMSSDEETVARVGAKVMPRSNGPSKSRKATLDDSDEDLPPPGPKGKGKPVPRLDMRSKDAPDSSKTPGTREAPKRYGSKKTKGVPKHKERVVDAIVLSDDSDDERLRPPSHKNESLSKRKSNPEQDVDPPEEGAGSAGTRAPIKVGPPRGVRRQEAPTQSNAPRKSKPSRPKPKEVEFADEHVAAEELIEQQAIIFDAPSPPPLLQDTFDIPISRPPLSRISIPNALPSPPPHSPELSPGAIERLKLFDQMMVDPSQPDVVPLVGPPEGGEIQPDPKVNYPDQLDDAHHDIHNGVGVPEPPHPLSPPPSKSKLKHTKLGTPNGLVVPETESSVISQSQSQSVPKPSSPHSPPPRDQPAPQPMDLPTIAVITCSASSSSSASLQDLIPPPQRFANRPLKRLLRPVPQISPNTFRSKVIAPPRSADPPSSIESFASPKRVDKGKQRAVEDSQVQNSLSEGEGARSRRETDKITDSELRKRGEELFNQTRLAREAGRLKKKKTKQLKNVHDIVNDAIFSPSRELSLPFANGSDNTHEIRRDEVVDLSGGVNSTTLNTPEQSEARSMSEEERNRLRIELRQEEEESSQEAILVYPSRPVSRNEGNAVQASVPGPSKHFPPNGGIADVDHLEQPSTDLQQASMIVQASQEPPREDTDVDPSPPNQHTSSPPRPIPENLTDSPKRRLGEALSLLNVKSEEIQRLERELSEEREKSQNLKAELAVVRHSSEPTGPVLASWEAERARWAEERSKWESDSSAWQIQRKTMSEERDTLLARVAELSDISAQVEETRVKLSELEAERVAWTKERDTLLDATTPQPEESAVFVETCREDDQDRLKWEAEKASWVEEKATWESERTALQEKQENLLRSLEELRASIESQRSATASAQKDRDFFREQYARASAFVGSVRDENLELEEKAKIAEGQAQEGVAKIKALYEGRFNALQADVARWKGLTGLLQEKDRRTDDEIRARAAQVPELVALCDRLAAENKSFGTEIRKLGRMQQNSVAQRKELCRKVLLLQNERKSLRSKFSRLVKMAGSSHGTSLSVLAPPTTEDPDRADLNDAETVPDPTPHFLDSSFDELVLFPCMWRPQWRDQCQLVFDTKEDLERHIQEHFRDLLVQ